VVGGATAEANGSGSLHRGRIIGALKAALEPLHFVDALQESGSAAWGRTDAWSDIDLNVFVEDGRQEETLRGVEGALQALAPIERTFTEEWPASSATAQRYYRLEGVSPFLIVDVAVIGRAAPDKMLEPELHGQGIVHFDKTGVTTVPPLDLTGFEEKRRARLVQLAGRTEMFHVFVDKEINRGNWIEAFDNYRAYVLGPLLELLRMQHRPLHHKFRARYVHYELPADVVARLQRLLFVRDGPDLVAKHREALDWFRATVTAVRERKG